MYYYNKVVGYTLPESLGLLHWLRIRKMDCCFVYNCHLLLAVVLQLGK